MKELHFVEEFQIKASKVLELIQKITEKVDKNIIDKTRKEFEENVKELNSFMEQLKQTQMTKEEEIQFQMIDAFYDQIKNGIQLMEKIINENN